MVKFALVFSLVLLFSTAKAEENTFSKEVVPSVELALSWVKKSPLPPPYFAHIMDLATECGVRSMHLQTYSEPFALAFLLTLESLEPKWKGIVDEALNKKILSPRSLPETKMIIYALERNWLSKKIRNIQMAAKPFDVTSDIDGMWRPTLPQYTKAVLPKWEVLLKEESSRVAELSRGLIPPHIYSPTYYAELDEVQVLGDKTNYNSRYEAIAKFWAGNTGSVTPPGMWLEAGLMALRLSNYRDSERVKIFKGLTYSQSLAGIMAWKVKYQFNLWRPITAIRQSGQDLSWLPRLHTPPFPSYVSGHSTFSGAAAAFLEAHGLNLLTFKDENNRKKTFTSAWEAALEAGKSRIYGGIHYEADNADGLTLGHRVACYVLKSMNRGCLRK